MKSKNTKLRWQINISKRFVCRFPDLERDWRIKVRLQSDWPGWTSLTAVPAWSELSSGTPTPHPALVSGMTWATQDTREHNIHHHEHNIFHHQMTVKGKKGFFFNVPLWCHSWNDKNRRTGVIHAAAAPVIARQQPAFNVGGWQSSQSARAAWRTRLNVM